MRSDGTALLMLADLIRYFSVYSLPGTTTGTGQSNDILRKIISYVNEHYTEKLSLEEVANQVGFSREYFCRFFKQHMGITFLRYLNEVRISHAGRILMKDAYRDAYGTAMLYAYRKQLADGTISVPELMNDYSPAAMDTVEKYLKLLKPNVAGWEADFGKEMMTKGKAWINMTWSGDAQWAIEEAERVGVHLAYSIPKEGSNIWYDGWVIPKYAKNVKAASYFINFLCRPDIALRNMEENGYVSAVAASEIMEACIDTTLTQTVDASYFFGPEGRNVKLRNTQYPDISIVNRCSMIRDFGDKTVNVLEIWSRIKGDNLNSGIVILILVVVAGLSIWQIRRRVLAYKRRRKQHRKRRRR